MNRLVSVDDDLRLPGFINAANAPRVALSVTATTGEPAVLDRIGHVVYAASGGSLYTSTDAGATFTLARTFPNVSGINAVKPLASGELLLVSSTNLYRTSGWASNPATATASSVLTSNGTAVFLPWGVDTHGSLIAAVDYQNPKTDSRYLKVSEDEGDTWDTVYDLNTEHPGEESLTHWHGLCWDAYHNPTAPRLWASYGDGPRAVIYTDDLGENWSTVPDTEGPDGTNPGLLGTGIQPTALVAAPAGVVCGTDEEPSGVILIHRDTLTYEWLHAVRLPGRTSGSLYGIAQRAQVADDGTIYIGFQNLVAGEPAVIVSVSPDGTLAREFYRIPGEVGQTHTVRSVVGVRGQVTIAATVAGTLTTLRTDTRAVSPSVGDAGGTRGGAADTLSVAAGSGSTAGPRSTASGVGASAAINAISHGYLAAAANNAIALGREATAGTYGIAIGYGTEASETSVVIGAETSVVGIRNTVVGHEATVGATNTNATALGERAKATGNYTVAIGTEAEATTSSSVAIGRRAKAGNFNDVALGDLTETTAGYQVAIGPRHIELDELSGTPLAPAANKGRLYIKDNGEGKTQLCVRFSSGGEIVIATQP